jgi:hypothetical protein
MPVDPIHIFQQEIVMSNRRTELEQSVVDALIASKAVNFEAIGGVLAKYGERAARTGDGLSFVVNARFVRDICIPPEPYGSEVGALQREVAV